MSTSWAGFVLALAGILLLVLVIAVALRRRPS
jgi:hypothetical protein